MSLPRTKDEWVRLFFDVYNQNYEYDGYESDCKKN